MELFSRRKICGLPGIMQQTPIIHQCHKLKDLHGFHQVRPVGDHLELSPVDRG
jgi:hypothetical protein